MKLELKHLAPYLPYNLKLKINTPIGTFNRDFQLDCGHDFNLHLSQGNVKPILRPLSDIYKELSVDGNFGFIPSKRLSDEYLNFSYWGENTIGKGILNEKHKMINLCFISDEIVGECPLAIYEQLLEWHFDVFGLIDKGLAISIHDVEQVIA